MKRCRQQDYDSHDDGKQSYEAAALGRALQHPDDPVIDDREAKYVDGHGQQDQRQSPRPAGPPWRYVCCFPNVRHFDRHRSLLRTEPPRDLIARAGVLSLDYPLGYGSQVLPKMRYMLRTDKMPGLAASSRPSAR
jgi:hypothetical protein